MIKFTCQGKVFLLKKRNREKDDISWLCHLAGVQIREPVMFLSGSRDEMVPASHMRDLFQASAHNPNRYFVEFPTGMHMDTWLRGGERYWRVIQVFLEQHARRHDASNGDMKDSLCKVD